MKLPHGKRVVLGLSLGAIGVGSLFLWWASSRTEERAPVRRAVVADNPDHEWKELSVELQKNPGHTPILMRMAQIEHDRGKLPDAAGHLREVIGREPGNADAHLELGRVLYESGDWGEGIKETEKALAINPKHVDALYNLGAISANAGNSERARAYWKSAVDVDPQSDSGKKARAGLARLQEVKSSK